MPRRPSPRPRNEGELPGPLPPSLPGPGPGPGPGSNLPTNGSRGAKRETTRKEEAGHGRKGPNVRPLREHNQAPPCATKFILAMARPGPRSSRPPSARLHPAQLSLLQRVHLSSAGPGAGAAAVAGPAGGGRITERDDAANCARGRRQLGPRKFGGPHAPSQMRALRPVTGRVSVWHLILHVRLLVLYPLSLDANQSRTEPGVEYSEYYYRATAYPHPSFNDPPSTRLHNILF